MSFLFVGGNSPTVDLSVQLIIMGQQQSKIYLPVILVFLLGHSGIIISFQSFDWCKAIFKVPEIRNRWLKIGIIYLISMKG